MLSAVVHPANLQDRDGAVLVLDEHTRRLFPFLENRGGQAPGRSKGLRGPAQALGRGAHHRLDQPLPAPGQGLREPQPNRPRLHPPRQYQAYAAKVNALLCAFINFPDGLLQISLREKWIRIVAKIVPQGCHFIFQLAEAAIPSTLFAKILRLIDGLRSAPLPPWRRSIK